MTETVLIADDHPLFRRGLREVIGRTGAFQVVAEVGDGLEAMQGIRELGPSIAVLDVSMPRLDGLEVVRQAQGWPSAPAFVLLTIHDSYAEQAFDLGVLGYVLKEDAEEEIVECLTRVARGQRHVSPGCRVLTDAGSAAVESPIALLTPTERRVLKLVGELKTSREIASILSVSHRTVQNHRANVCTKLGLRGNKALLRLALAYREESGGSR